MTKHWFLDKETFLWASLVETLIYKISINLSKARRSFSWDVSDWKLHCQDSQICIFHISSISHVCPGHDREERAFCWNPGTFDLNLGCKKIEWESFINVTYQEVLFSFLCKVKKKIKNPTNPKLFELSYCVGKALSVTLTLAQEAGSPQRQPLNFFFHSSPHIDRAAKLYLSLSLNSELLELIHFILARYALPVDDSGCTSIWKIKESNHSSPHPQLCKHWSL